MTRKNIATALHTARKNNAPRAKIWHTPMMLDRFDRMLLNLVQLDSARTADSLARDLPLSPSAIARRLRRHKRDGTIHRTISLLSPRLAQDRLRVIATLQLGDHGDHKAIRALEAKLAAAPAVQFAFELAGSIDLVVMLDFANMQEFNETFRALIQDDPTVHRFECYFVKREFRFAPFIDLLGADDKKGAAESRDALIAPEG
jgi:Lrp/AsnC family transcriptional regulator, leucine-responsive regulatory protein